MLGWFMRRFSKAARQEFRTGYVNRRGFDLSEYMPEEEARRFAAALAGSVVVVYNLEYLIRYYKLYDAISSCVADELQESLVIADEDLNSPLVMSAIIRWLTKRPPLVFSKNENYST